MAELRLHISISLDGFVAGPNQSEENPLGEGRMQLHEWAFELAAWREPHEREGGEVNASTEIVEEMRAGVGATLMGRNMFGGGPGPWGEEPWEGWWGEEPPFGMPVFVLTHHPRETLQLGKTTFTLVTEGIEPALERAKHRCRAGSGRRSAAPFRPRRPDPFYVCGSDQWVCDYMEGAVRTGRAAAAAALG